MTLKYFHAEPAANSLKSMIPLLEKGLDFQSVYVDLHKFEQHSEWFLAINPEGQVPVLDHDGILITHTTHGGYHRAQDRGRRFREDHGTHSGQGGKTARADGMAGGKEYTLADINFYSLCGMMVERMFPELEIARRCPRLVEWRENVTARPAVARALAGEDRTEPGLRTWTGHAR